MKIGPFTVKWPFIRETLAAISADTAKGILARTQNDVYKPKDITSYFDAYTDDDLIRAMVDDLAESVAGNGFYITVESLIEEGRKPGGVKVKELSDDFKDLLRPPHPVSPANLARASNLYRNDR